jgi:hypothetical protein
MALAVYEYMRIHGIMVTFEYDPHDVDTDMILLANKIRREAVGER